MQIPGETAAPLIKRLRGAGWSAGGAGWPPGRATPREGAAGGARGGGASRRRPALRHPSERGNCTRDTHVPAGGGWGGREGGWAGGREEPEGGTDGRDRGRAGVGEGAREGRGVLVETAPLHPWPAAVASTAGGAVPGARAASPSPHGSLAPGDGKSRAPEEPASRTPFLVRAPQSASTRRVPGSRLPVRGPSRREAPTQGLGEKSTPRGPWMAMSSPLGLHTSRGA